jgi:hypothetical protein
MTVYRRAEGQGTVRPLRSGGGPPYASFAENLLNAAFADLELFSQFSGSRPGAVARDKATYACLGQPIADSPDAWSLLSADATASIDRLGILVTNPVNLHSQRTSRQWLGVARPPTVAGEIAQWAARPSHAASPR